MSRPVNLRRYIRDELRDMQAEPSKAHTKHGAWVLGIAKKHGWFPRVAAGVVAEANKMAGMTR